MAPAEVNAEMQALYKAEYARLRTSIDLGGTLVHLRQPQQQRPVLDQIILNGNTTLESTGAVADPYLLSNTRMTLAAADYDLASAETKDDTRARRITSGTRQCETAVKIALESGTTMLSMEILPWALVVLTGGLRAARGAERAPVQALMISCAEALPRMHEQMKSDRQLGARTLFEAQLLLRGAGQLTDPVERGVVLARAAEVGRDARRILLGAGDRDAARQAQALLAEIDASLARIATAAARAATERSRQPARGPATAADYPKFCPSCGTKTTGKKFCVNCGTRLAG